MTTGSILFFGGIGGIAVSMIGLVICLAIFPKKRRRLLEKLSEE